MRNLSTINVPIICIGFIVLCVCAGFACAARVTTETRYRREQALHVLLYIAAAIVLVAGKPVRYILVCSANEVVL